MEGQVSKNAHVCEHVCVCVCVCVLCAVMYVGPAPTEIDSRFDDGDLEAIEHHMIGRSDHLHKISVISLHLE